MNKGLKGHIAIVDDDPLVRAGLRDCMESAGYAVDDFGSAEDFLASNSRESAVCLILDVQLPGISGLALQDWLSAAAGHPPIVFLTAHANESKRDIALCKGAIAFLSKPVRREQLLDVVKMAIKP
jgi:FixJ family two-component response regulator